MGRWMVGWVGEWMADGVDGFWVAGWKHLEDESVVCWRIVWLVG